MTAHTSTAASVLSRRALLLNGVAMAALAAFSPVTAAAIGKETTREKETKMKTATTQLDTTQRSAADAIRPFHIHVSEEALTNLGYVRDTGLCCVRHNAVSPAHQIMPRASLSTAFYPQLITCARVSYAP
jgi:hypothetical protein